MSALLLHWPHILPILLAFATVVYLWRAEVAHRRQREAPASSTAPVDPVAAEAAPLASVAGPSASATTARAVRMAASPVVSETARRGAIVLGPLLGAMATGAVIYGLDLSSRRAGGGLVWTHAGLSILLCLLAVYKLAATDWADARRHWRMTQAAPPIGPLLLAALLIPILLTGIVMLVQPSGTSFSANLHLIASAWWTLLALWHLARYASRSMRTLLTSSAP
jgi:hypothetical protein